MDRRIISSLVFSVAIIGAGFFFGSNTGHDKVFAQELIGAQGTVTGIQSGDLAPDNEGGVTPDGGGTNPPASLEGGTVDDDGEVGDGGPGGPGDGGPTGPVPLCGFAWGATSELPTPKMGVGWVSFSSKDCDTDDNGTISSGEAAAHPGCPTGGSHSYGVSMDPATGLLTGYAWSNNIGWIKFGGLNSFPTGSGTTASNATVQSNGYVLGWARACAGTDTGDCSAPAGRSDGWDGWISLSGTGSSSGGYGIVYNATSNSFSGYSWGGSVVGWLRWDQTSGDGVRSCATPTLMATLTPSPTHGMAPFSPTLTAGYTLTSGSGTANYSFRCDYSTSWSATSTSNTYNGCGPTYSQYGAYWHPQVVVAVSGLTATATAEVYNDPLPPPNTGPLTPENEAVCSVDPGQILINQDSAWTAGITAVGPLTYKFTFDGDTAHMITQVTSNTQLTVNRTFNTLGAKHVHVDILNGSGSSVGSCDASANVIVRPTIIEQ